MQPDCADARPGSTVTNAMTNPIIIKLFAISSDLSEDEEVMVSVMEIMGRVGWVQIEVQLGRDGGQLLLHY